MTKNIQIWSGEERFIQRTKIVMGIVGLIIIGIIAVELYVIFIR